MERSHRYYSLHRILSSRRLPVPRAVIEEEPWTKIRPHLPAP